ncbi:MAG: hypothetical protein ACRELG_30180 [Gemmataceae bacterium]
MEPLKPETKARILHERPQASPEDIEEYERLLAERFTEDPDLPKSPAIAQTDAERKNRLEQLYEKLFATGNLLIQSWDQILTELENFLGAKEKLNLSEDPATTLEELTSIILPALCRRLCELASLVDPATGNTSADIMICHANNDESGILSLRVYESFPNYSLDRFVLIHDNNRMLHKREVHYKDRTGLDVNREVVSQAIIRGITLACKFRTN